MELSNASVFCIEADSGRLGLKLVKLTKGSWFEAARRHRRDLAMPCYSDIRAHWSEAAEFRFNRISFAIPMVSRSIAKNNILIVV